ncbi:uncharacterized protein LOC132752063 [Ruditapes philippinarum]|uniref:uncharacterized protein LOC132752063 n=1 Tax=Ruditapes philippinarum TaxID=129788 RepID=UPI00295A96C7|nr:uncharacterized protein LOC132752063 [Ruditapes philippinarum]XP_060598315.1 uncharacterized protein LOC132752063 [Ruditapes philippinarum]
MDYYKNTDVIHDGSYELSDNPCHVEFTKTSFKQYLCIYGDDISLDCGTLLEYHEAFVKNHIQPERKMSCNNITKEEWCPSQYQDKVFVVIRKPSRHTSDVIKLRVYLKDVPVPETVNDALGVSLTIILCIIFIPVAFVVMCSCLFGIVHLKSRKNTSSRPHVAYQTSSGAVNMQTAPSFDTSVPPPSYESIMSQKLIES